MQIRKLKIAEWAIDLRKIDPYTVSRYRSAMRTGAIFPPVIYDRKTHEIICGNHRMEAAHAEFGEDYDISAEGRSFKSHAERLRLFARDNATHGAPLDGYSRRKIALALQEEGETPESISQLFNIPVTAIEKWGGQTVWVIGSGPKLVKRSINIDTVQKVSAVEYAEHEKRDYGVPMRALASQVIRHITSGWEPKDDGTRAVLVDLRECLQKHGY